MKEEIFNSLSEDLQYKYMKYCLPDDLTGLTLNSVILSDINRSKLNQFLVETEHKEKFAKYNLPVVNRIINSGASGTGKTFSTKCLAAHLDYELLSVDIAKALAGGEVLNAISDIFEIGNTIGKAIIFLDECDSVAKRRTSKEAENEDPQVKRAITAIFQQVDRMNPECIFIACTNLYNQLDDAFVRRFNYHMEFLRPPLDNFESTIKHFMHPDFNYVEDMDKSLKDIVLEYAKTFAGLSYGGIEDWVQRAEKQAIIRDEMDVKESEIYFYFMQNFTKHFFNFFFC